MSRRRRAAVTGLAVMLATTLTGCTMSQLPTYDEVVDETHAAMQEVVDLLPPGTPLEEIENEPLACDDGGVFYTGHWVLRPADPEFDTAAFIDELPAELGSSYEVEERETEVTFPVVDLRALEHGNTLVGVSGSRADEDAWIDITAISRCAQPLGE